MVEGRKCVEELHYVGGTVQPPGEHLRACHVRRPIRYNSGVLSFSKFCDWSSKHLGSSSEMAATPKDFQAWLLGGLRSESAGVLPGTRPGGNEWTSGHVSVKRQRSGWEDIELRDDFTVSRYCDHDTLTHHLALMLPRIAQLSPKYKGDQGR